MSIARSRKLSISALFSLVGLVGLTAVSAGCSASTADEHVGARLDVVDRTASALSSNAITSITGTYGGACAGRAALGTDSWTLSVSGGPAADELSVRKNDAHCILTVTNVVAGGSNFIGNPAMSMTAANTYQASASAFAEASGPLAFYANAKISALTFGADFTITMLVSDAPNASDAGDKHAAFATQSGTLEAGTVPASNYTIGLGSFGVAKDVNNVVQSVSGYAQLAEESVTGQAYAVVAGALTGSSTFAEVDAAFAGATNTGLLSDLTSLRLPATGFGLSGLDLDTSPQRTVIIRNTVDGVSSYQMILITFIP